MNISWFIRTNFPAPFTNLQKFGTNFALDFAKIFPRPWIILILVMNHKFWLCEWSLVKKQFYFILGLLHANDFLCAMNFLLQILTISQFYISKSIFDAFHLFYLRLNWKLSNLETRFKKIFSNFIATWASFWGIRVVNRENWVAR